MKKVVLFCLVTFGFLPMIHAQGDSKIKELYLSGDILRFSNLSLQYKSQTKRGNYLRLGISNLNFEASKKNPFTPTSYGTSMTDFDLTFDLGIEKRKQIIERIQIFYGLDLIGSTSFNREKTEDPTKAHDLRFMDSFTLSPGLGFNSGFLINIFKNLSVAAEIMPLLRYSYSAEQHPNGDTKYTTKTNTANFYLSNHDIRVSIVYQWRK